MPYSISYLRGRFLRLISLDPSPTELITVFLGLGWVLGAVGAQIFQVPVVEWAYYSGVVEVLPIGVWSLLFLVGSMVQGLGLLSEEKILRRVACGFQATLFCWFASLIWAGESWPYFMTWVYAVIGVANAWAWVQLDRMGRA